MPLTRRELLYSALAAGSLAACQRARAADANPARQASGVKVGEMTPHRAVVWARLTQSPVRNDPTRHLNIEGRWDRHVTPPPAPPPARLAGACPGAAGRMRVRFGRRTDLTDARNTPWVAVGPATDFSHRFELDGLTPDAAYFFATETADDAGIHAPVSGQFRTAPDPDAATDLRFCVITCQSYHRRDHRDGFGIYPAMRRLNPHFLVTTGDNVYYDLDQPAAVSMELARYHWQRMFSLPRLAEFYRHVGCYFAKDDHDTLKDDTWTGQTYGEVDFARGQQIFREQVPILGSIFRTFRWGRDLQIWITDGRDFRSANDLPDGPQKTIWGAEQKAWLKESLLASNATWKLLISPTPIVGPDRAGKADSHANPGFRYEGDEIRSWLRQHVSDRLAVICGDRHWQYHSVHPETKLEEFSVGPASDTHAGGSPGEDREYHRFHRVKGGFLSVDVRPHGRDSILIIEHRDVTGAVVNRVEKRRRV
jgi:alkaline phosphatase D